MKKSFILLSTCVGLGAVFGLAYVFHPDKDASTSKVPSVPNPKKTPNGIVPPDFNDDFPLMSGSSGTRVAKLQAFLLRNYGWTGPIKGHFDDYTLQKVKRHLGVSKVDEALYNKLRINNLKLS